MAKDSDRNGKSQGSNASKAKKSGEPKQKGELYPVTTDSRFARIHSDPRFAKIKRDATKISIDKRFAGMLSSKEFGSSDSGPKVDKYGRRKTESASKDLQRFYKLEEQEEDQDEQQEDEEDEVELKSRDQDEQGEEEDEDLESTPGLDLARGEGLLESSDDDDDDDDDDEEDVDETAVADADDQSIQIGPYAEENVPVGDETRRFAVVNMDWDNVRARDLYKVFDAFKPKTGILHSVTIYPSEFGKERLASELIHGPPAEIFKSTSDDEDGDTKNGLLVNDDDGKEFNTTKLRKYQLERLRYYYAVVECDSVETARAIYQACDSTEFESTANFFDLRYIPDGMTFDDKPHDVASDAPVVYQPADFVTNALQHSNVKLTWDDEDPERTRITRRKFTKENIRDMDFKAYIASSDEEDEDDLGVGADADALRAKYRALIASEGDADAFGRKNLDEGENIEITFAPGLSEKAASMLERKKEEEARKGESVFDAYMRKRKEKRKLRQQAYEGKTADGNKDQDEDESEDDMAGREDDPFFNEDFGSDYETKPAKSKSKSVETPAESKAEKRKNKAAAEAENARSKAELELLLMDETNTQNRHFDMKAVIKNEKAAKRKQKGSKNKLGKDLGDTQDDFQIDVADPRFSAILDSHQFAIDPTNPQFKKTKAMEKVLMERRSKIAAREYDGSKQPQQDKDSDDAKKPEQSATDLKQLVAAVKRKSNLAVQSGQGKRQKK